VTVDTTHRELHRARARVRACGGKREREG
jgi:hypothetical protein